MTYTVDSRDLLRAGRDAEARGDEIVGCWHSHTHTDAYPSPTDVRQAGGPDWMYVIVSLRDQRPMLRAYRIRDGADRRDPGGARPGLTHSGLGYSMPCGTRGSRTVAPDPGASSPRPSSGRADRRRCAAASAACRAHRHRRHAGGRHRDRPRRRGASRSSRRTPKRVDLKWLWIDFRTTPGVLVLVALFLGVVAAVVIGAVVRRNRRIRLNEREELEPHAAEPRTTVDAGSCGNPERLRSGCSLRSVPDGSCSDFCTKGPLCRSR